MWGKTLGFIASEVIYKWLWIESGNIYKRFRVLTMQAIYMTGFRQYKHEIGKFAGEMEQELII